jgi:hypothetical protein
MSIASVTQTLALQREHVRPELPRLFPMDDTLWAEIKPRGDIETVSYRPTRVPQYLLSGGKHRMGTFDGADMQQGSSFTTDFYTLVPVYPFSCWQYSKLTEITTNNDQKAIENYGMRTMKEAMAEFNVFMEALLNTDGSNTLDTVVSTATNQITVNNANQFRDNNDYDIWSALSGTFRGTVTVQSVDTLNNQLNLTGALPPGTTANDLLLVSGSAGVAGTGFLGIKFYQVNSNTGSIGGLARAAYPGKLTTPFVNFNNQTLTPAKARLMLAQMQIAMGIDQPDKVELTWNMNVDMVAAWENAGLLVSSVIANQLTGQNSIDMLKKSPPKTLAGRPIVGGGKGSIHATPGRIDGLPLKHLFRVENQPIDFYEVGGQTTFPAYGASGGLASSTMFYLWTGVNLGDENVHAGTFGSNIAIPSGYFGH